MILGEGPLLPSSIAAKLNPLLIPSFSTADRCSVSSSVPRFCRRG
jgi:hypothetical protein